MRPMGADVAYLVIFSLILFLQSGLRIAKDIAAQKIGYAPQKPAMDISVKYTQFLSQVR